MVLKNETFSGLPQQVAIIRRAESLSQQIIEEIPEIADDYRGGVNQREIAEKYKLDQEEGMAVARTAISLALKKLIPNKRERRKLKDQIQKRAGYEVLEDKIGIHKFTREQRNKLALHCGMVPWEDHLFDPETEMDEMHYCIELLQNPRLKRGKNGRLCMDYERIAKRLNRVFHKRKPIRTATSVRNFKYQKSGL